MLASMGAVAAGHATDLWGVVLVTVGVLVRRRLLRRFDSLGPAGNDARIGVGDLLGWGRFLVPPVLIAVGIRMFMGRCEDDDPAGPDASDGAGAGPGRHRRGPAAAGRRLAALAGGSPGDRGLDRRPVVGRRLGGGRRSPTRSGRARRLRGGRGPRWWWPRWRSSCSPA